MKNFNKLLKTVILIFALTSPVLSIAQGLEDFSKSNLNNKYKNGSFVGNNDITWSYIKSRDENNDANGSGIAKPAIMLRRLSDNSNVSSSTISGGIGSFSVKLYKGFTGQGNRQVELFINGESKGQSEGFNDLEEHVFSVENINIEGDFTIEIRNITEKQVIVDDISWTAYPAVTPAVPVISDISIAPTAPTSTDDVKISATITDDVAITEAKVFWASHAGVTDTDNEVAMTNDGDVYSADIPAQANGATVYYIILASDGTDTTISAEASYTVADLAVDTVSLPYTRDFETGDLYTDGWTTQLVTGTIDWKLGDYSGKHFAKMSNYSKGSNSESETWFISPAINLTTAKNPVFSFDNSCKYEGADLEVYVSADYKGFGEPSSANWTALNPTLSSGYFQFVSSGEMDLSAYEGQHIFVAFKYTGSATDGKTWQVDNIEIKTTEPKPTHLWITDVTPVSPIVGEEFSLKVVALDDDNQAINVTENTVIKINKVYGDGNLVVENDTIKAGQSEIVFSGMTFDKADTLVIKAIVEEGMSLTASENDTIVVVPIEPTHLWIAEVTPASPKAGEEFSLKVVALDADEQPANVVERTEIAINKVDGDGNLVAQNGVMEVGESEIVISGITFDNADTIVIVATRISGMGLNDSENDTIIIKEVTVATHLAIKDVTPASPEVGKEFSLTVVALDALEEPANLTQNTVIKINKVDGDGNLVVENDTIKAGQSEIIFSGITYSQVDTIVINAMVEKGETLTTSENDTIIIQEPIVPTHLVIENVTPETPKVGEDFNLTVVALDRYDNPSVVSENTQIHINLIKGTGNLIVKDTTIKADASEITFSDLKYDKADTIVINASVVSGMALMASVNDTIVIAPLPPTHLVITDVSPVSPKVGKEFGLKVIALDKNDEFANVTEDTEIKINLLKGTGNLTVENATIVAGTNEISLTGLTYDKADTIVINASVENGMSLTTSVNDTIVVAPTLPTHLVISNVAPLSPNVNKNFSFTVIALDEDDKPANVTEDTEVGITLTTGTGNLTAENATIVAGTSEITFTASYDVAEEIQINASIVSGMMLTASENQSITIAELPNIPAVFISEYIEGSGNNKAIEIYNGSGASIDLSDFVISLTKNGSDWDSQYTFTFSEGTMLEDKDVYVIASNQAVAALKNKADTLVGHPAVVSYNGNDAVGLQYAPDGSGWILADIIGVPSVAVEAWSVAGVENATKEHTLVRKTDVEFGNTDWATAAGTDADNSEWIVLDKNDFTHIGWHGEPSTDTVISILKPENNSTIYTTNTDVELVVENFNVAENGGDGHIVLKLDNVTTDIYSTEHELTDLSVAEHTLIATLVDNDGNALEPAVADTVVFTVANPESITIKDIQYTTDASGDSPYKGQIVTTQGIVTGVKQSSKGVLAYFIQDGQGEWNGVYVYDNTNTVALGDKISITADVDEYYGLTELKNVTSFNVISSGNELPAPTVVSSQDANAEAYEGVLLKIENANCTNADAGNGMWEINDGSGALKVDDDLFHFSPTVNAVYNVVGLGHYSYSEYKILPRNEQDITIVGGDIDHTSLIEAPATQVASQIVNGLTAINMENAVEAFRFKITDQGGDGLPTKVNTMKVVAGEEQNIDITSDVAGAYLKFADNDEMVVFSGLPELSQEEIVLEVNPGTAVIPEGASRELICYIWFKPEVADEAKVQMVIASEHGFVSEASNSQFVATIPEAIVGNVLTVDKDISTNEISENSVTIYPNPTTDFVNITGLENAERIEIINTLGQIVISENVTASTKQTNISDLAAGVYTLKIISGNNVVTKNLIIQ